MATDYEARLYNEAVASINFRAFFADKGLTIDPAARVDENGWTEATGCTFTEGKIHVNLRTGDWCDPLTKKTYPIHDFIIRNEPLEDGDVVGALRVLCQAAGIKYLESVNFPAPETGVATPTSILQDLCKDLTGTLRHRLSEATGISASTMQRYQMGYIPADPRGHSGKFLVPIPEPNGTVKAIRQFDEELQGRWLRRIPHCNRLDITPKLYGLDELALGNWKNVVLCNNELDRMILMQERKSEDWGALTVIDSFLHGWLPYLKGRHVVLCFSSDRPSMVQAQSVIGPMLRADRDKGGIASVKLVTIPGGGSADFCRVYHWFQAGGNWDALLKLATQAKGFQEPCRGNPDTEPRILENFGQIDDPDNTDQRVRVPVTVIGDYRAVYDVPEEFMVKHCLLTERQKCSECIDLKFKIPFGNAAQIECCGANRTQIDRICNQIVGCRNHATPRLEVTSKITLREILVSQYYERIVDRSEDEEGLVQMDGLTQKTVERQVYVRVEPGQADLTQPRGFMATGWVRTDPRNSRRTLILETLDPIPEPYENFNYKMRLEELKGLQALGWQGLVRDLVEHRTHIYDCDELLLLVLMTYCSPLHLHFNGEMIRGWITAAIIGDSGVGKSKTFETISEMLRLGDIFSCRTGRRTGLTYCLVRRKDGPFKCQAGVVPRNSRKIVCVEETQELGTEDIKTLADSMHKGVMAVGFSDSATYESKTRMIFMANPRYDRTLESYTYGVLALKDVFYTPSVIRRLDVAAFLRRFEDQTRYNRMCEPTEEPRVTPSALRALVLLAWSMSPERIVFTPEVTALVLKRATELSATYGHPEDVPLVSPTDFRQTLARLCAALAIIDLSSTDELATITVRPKHVEEVSALVHALYSHPSCGLDRYSEVCRRSKSLEDFELIATEITQRVDSGGVDALGDCRHFSRLLYLLNQGNAIRRSDLVALVGCSPVWMREALDFLTNIHLTRCREVVTVTHKFTRFMSRYAKENPVAWALIKAAGKALETKGKK